MTGEKSGAILVAYKQMKKFGKGRIPMADRMLVTQALDERDLLVKKIQDIICHPDKQEEVTMTDSWVTTHDARPFNDRVVHSCCS